MTGEALKYLNESFEALGIPYEYMQWSKGLQYPYFIGEYTEIEQAYEDGNERGTFILTGTTSGDFLTLEAIKEKVKEFFPADGRTEILESGSGLAVCYSTAFPVITGEPGLKRLQINLNIQEWRC